MSYNRSGADPKPTRFCVGTIGALEPTRLSKSGNCLVKTINLNGEGSAMSNNYHFCYTPEMFAAGFRPQATAKGTKFLFDTHVLTRDIKKLSFNPSPEGFDSRVGLAGLEGLCGSQEKFDEVFEQLQAAYNEANDDNDVFGASVDTVLAQLEGLPVGYCLKQQMEDTSEVNDRGFPVKVPGAYHSVAGFFYPDDKKQDKQIKKSVEAYNEKGLMWKAFVTYDNETPFSATQSTAD